MFIYYFFKKNNSVYEVFNNINCFHLMNKKYHNNAYDELNNNFENKMNKYNNF